MHQDTLSQQALNFCQVLIQAGAIPGEDFSFDSTEGTCRLSERAYQLLIEAYPDLDWAEAFAVSPRDSQTAIALLHTHLGVKFVDRMLAQIPNQLARLPRAEANWYVQQVLIGVEVRTGIPLYTLLHARLSPAQQQQVALALEESMHLRPCGEWMVDLVQAAGGEPEDAILDGADALLTERGMWLLGSVWTGEIDPMEELARDVA
jgi:hypothetical protein